MKTQSEPLTAEQLRAQLLHIIERCEEWTNTGAIASMLDTDTPRARVLSMLQTLSIDRLVDYKRDKASDLWMRMTSSERPVVAQGSALKTADLARDTPAPLHAPVRRPVAAPGKTRALVAELLNADPSLTDSQIGARIGVGSNTVNYHRNNIKKGDGATPPPPPSSSPVPTAASMADAARAARSDRLNEKPTRRVNGAARFARWSTGELVIESADQSMQLTAIDVDALLAFVYITQPPRSAA